MTAAPPVQPADLDRACPHACDHCCPEAWHSCVRPSGHRGHHSCVRQPGDEVYCVTDTFAHASGSWAMPDTTQETQ